MGGNLGQDDTLAAYGSRIGKRGDAKMRWSVLVPFLALGVPACVDYPPASIPSVAPSATPADKIGVPAADRLLLERVRFASPTYEAEWAGAST